jgi:hypothetical protein
MCGHTFDESEVEDHGCQGCGKGECNTIHCPNCGFGNTSKFDDEFKFIKSLKEKFSKKSNSSEK